MEKRKQRYGVEKEGFQLPDLSWKRLGFKYLASKKFAPRINRFYWI
jgi:hypothetical protein